MLFSLFINRRIQERWTLRSCKVWWLPPSPILWKKEKYTVAVGNGVWVVDSSFQGSLHVGLERKLTQYQPHGVGGWGGTAVLLYFLLIG